MQIGKWIFPNEDKRAIGVMLLDFYEGLNVLLSTRMTIGYACLSGPWG